VGAGVTRLNHFQTYSQPENHATNNTLLMLRHALRLGSARFERILSALIDGLGFTVGPAFTQQDRATRSVPDGFIRQDAFQIWLEAKRGGEVDEPQILAHIDHASTVAGGRGDRVVLAVTRHVLAKKTVDRLRLLAENRDVTFAACTFEEIVAAVRSQLREDETDFADIVNDYEAFLESDGLLSTDFQRLAVFPCGWSIRENASLRFYCEPPERSVKRTPLIGLYHDKTVRYLGRVEAVATCDWRSGQPAFIPEVGELNDRLKARIIDIISTTNAYDDLKANATRFYLMGDMAETEIRKTSPRGIMGFQYLSLRKIGTARDIQSMSIEALASEVRSLQFPQD
jgi:hypothetical protein